MRVCIVLGGLAMGGPTGMCDSNSPGYILLLRKMLQLGNFSFCLVYFKMFMINQCYAGTVVTAVFESVKTFDQNGISLPVADISNYSTHRFFIYKDDFIQKR